MKRVHHRALARTGDNIPHEGFGFECLTCHPQINDVSTRGAVRRSLVVELRRLAAEFEHAEVAETEVAGMCEAANRLCTRARQIEETYLP